MQKAIRNQSGKPTTVESLDKREEARQKPSANPLTVMSPHPKDRAAAARATGTKLDRDYESNRREQARREGHQGSDDGAPQTQFRSRSEG